MADIALLYVAIACAVRRGRDVFLLRGTALTAGAATSAYGLAQALGSDPFAWAVDPRSRPFATFGNADHFGHFLSVFFGLALGLLIAGGSARARVAAAVSLAGALGMSTIVATRATVLGVAAALITAAFVGRPTTRSLVTVGTVELWRLARERPGIGPPLLLGWVAYWADGLVAATSLAAVWFPPVALGCAAALRGSRDVERAPKTVARWAAVALALVAILGAATGARALQANRDAWTSEEASPVGDRDAAITFADRAAARDGGRADNWNRLGLALEAAGRNEAAADAYREASRREPYEAVYWVNLARAIARGAGSDAAKREDAIASASEATSVDPNAPIGHVALAEIAVAFGRCELARTEAARAIALEGGHEDLVQRTAACR